MKSARPLISVILTSYNYAQYVREAIDSVFGQTYRPVELIIVDDGSRDDSREVIEAHIRNAPIPVRTLFKANGGQSSAINEGFPLVQGEITGFIDSDDVWFPHKLEAMADFVGHCPDGGVYQHQVEVGFGGPNRLEYMVSGDVFNGWKQIGPRINLAVHQGRVSPFVPTVGLMFRTAILKRVMPIPTRLITCPDAFLTRTCTEFGPLYSHPAILATWRDHPENAGKSEATSYHDYWLGTIRPTLNDYYRERGIPIELYYEKQNSDPPAAPASPINRNWLSRIFGTRRSD